ncbi:hypothetical protein EVAR_62447_1 [Eumeta japonica]|uniref:Uncharacterized protein n=1 Tax=Eumeta variegata TaxID=151549 RepID=A0A4C1Z301_EUMVA|nr:hypothetical protein EVAR_62447_1 [Eumeta japonica]
MTESRRWTSSSSFFHYRLTILAKNRLQIENCSERCVSANSGLEASTPAPLQVLHFLAARAPAPGALLSPLRRSRQRAAAAVLKTPDIYNARLRYQK